MTDNDKSRTPDEAVAAELKGVPEEFLDKSAAEMAEDDTSALDRALERLRDDLEAAKQEMLYAKAETQNVRRRMEKDVIDARNYAATGFARDVLSIGDNLARAMQAVPDELREDERLKGLLAGIEATQREMEKIFTQHGITRIASVGLPLDPNQHQAMMEVPSDAHEPGD